MTFFRNYQLYGSKKLSKPDLLFVIESDNLKTPAWNNKLRRTSDSLASMILFYEEALDFPHAYLETIFYNYKKNAGRLLHLFFYFIKQNF